MRSDWEIEIEPVREGYGWIVATVNERMLNGYGTAYNGALFTIADAAPAYACNSPGRQAVAHAASVQFLDPARPGERTVAEAREIILSGRSGTPCAR